MRKMRMWAKALIGFEFMLSGAQVVAGGILSLLGLIVVIARGEWQLVLPYAGGVVFCVAVVGLVWAAAVWITRDARKSRQEIRLQRQKREPRPDGDMSDVVGMPGFAPWMS